MNIDPKLLKTKCKNLLEQYEDILIYIADREEMKIRMMDIVDKDQYEFIKKTFFSKGIIEGMKRLIAKINEESR